MITIADHVLRFYVEFMTDHERAVDRHLTAVYKSTRVVPGPDAKPNVEQPVSRWASNDPAVLADAAAGWGAAREKIAQRILQDDGDRVFLNYCPKCGALTRTPEGEALSRVWA